MTTTTTTTTTTSTTITSTGLLSVRGHNTNVICKNSKSCTGLTCFFIIKNCTDRNICPAGLPAETIRSCNAFHSCIDREKKTRRRINFCKRSEIFNAFNGKCLPKKICKYTFWKLFNCT